MKLKKFFIVFIIFFATQNHLSANAVHYLDFKLLLYAYLELVSALATSVCYRSVFLLELIRMVCAIGIRDNT